MSLVEIGKFEKSFDVKTIQMNSISVPLHSSSMEMKD